jgi:TonB-dependent receptor
MVSRRIRSILLSIFLVFAVPAFAQQQGGIRGTVYDKDFDAPLPGAEITIGGTDQKVESTSEGNYVFSQVKPGVHTLIFSKEGYVRQLATDIVVSPGQMAEVDASLPGDFAEMEEFVVQDVQIGSGSESELLQIRMESPALMDSISADLMSKAGAGDAASALRLVPGATVQDGKYAVIRGLPDRYVNSQLNGVRLPTADTDKRAVQLDQFPSAAIQSIQVSKTFTPDQQGDASGGAVNVILKGVPNETVFKIGVGTNYNTQVSGRDDFLTYKGGGVRYWGKDDGRRDVQTENVDGNWTGAAGVSTGEAPADYNWSLSAGGKHNFDSGIRVGALGSFFYDRSASYYKNGFNDKYWVETPGGPMTPQYSQGTPTSGDFKTSLFDITQGSQEVKWGALGTLGVETENNKLAFIYLFTRSTEDKATLAEDTRGKAFYFPGYDVNDPRDPGNQQRDAAPYLRMETLEYTERETRSAQFKGEHKTPLPELRAGDTFAILNPEFDWSYSRNTASLNQPDKRQFGSLWYAETYNAGYPPYILPFNKPEGHYPYKPAANFTIGNMQRVWKSIEENSEQTALNLKLPFEQWTGAPGYLKFGVFRDELTRDYKQDSYSNFGDNSGGYLAPWSDQWSLEFPNENHPMKSSEIDVDYTGKQKISAWYYMADMPLVSGLPLLESFNIIGGARFEDTELSIVNTPEQDVTWVPPGGTATIQLNPGEADVAYSQKDVLPSLGFVYKPLKSASFRGSYSQTVARQTFKELSPIIQQEYLGGDVFIGNPNLTMSAVENYDLRLDYTPFEGSLLSMSYFYKFIKDPIEYVQRIADFAYTTPVNYPEGKLDGYEFEARQNLGVFWNWIDGLSLGGNATLINSEVTLPEDEAAQFDQPNIQTPTSKRDMTNAPEYLYNAFLNYDMHRVGLKGTELGVFYTVRGDTLVAGAGQSKGNYVPDVYEKEYGTLNVSLSQKIGQFTQVKLQAKNLLDPKIQTVYRSKYIDGDKAKSSYRKGMEFSIGVSGEF